MNKELVFIGLGRMGAAMTANLIEQGYTVHGFDVSTETRAEAAKNGVKTYATTSEAVHAMKGTKVIWLMVPSKFVDEALYEIYNCLAVGDIIIDGGNSFFKDTLRRAEEATAKEFIYIDCGTSGGVDGARHGASLMVGGNEAVVKDIEHIFKALAAPNGYGHIGNTGSGHFVKMVHNSIEYGMMGAIAEGINYIEDHQEELQIDMTELLKPFENGSIITSNLMSWLADAYRAEGYLEEIAGKVPKGETETEMEYVAETGSTPVLEAALEQRKATRDTPSRTGTLIAAMRNQFGGHKTIKKEGE